MRLPSARGGEIGDVTRPLLQQPRQQATGRYIRHPEIQHDSVMMMAKTASLNAMARLVSDRVPMSSVGRLTAGGYPPMPAITGSSQPNRSRES
jgi:hypothetical protein